LLLPAETKTCCPYQELRANAFGGVEVPPIVRVAWVRREPIRCVDDRKMQPNDLSKSRTCEEWRLFMRQKRSYR
jgi:hypothetical protein